MILLQVIGHLGRDAVVSVVNGRKVINFSLAHSYTYNDKDGQKISASIWVNCSYWTEKTKVAEYLQKGTQIYVKGMPSVDSYKNQFNQTIPQLRLRVDEIQLLGGRRDQPEERPQFQPQSQEVIPPSSVDDLPF